MKAMIFAAGLGTRLKPLTDRVPKALLPLAGRPMLEHVILKLKAAGFDELVINIHHHGQQIIDFLKRQNDFGIRIAISDERDYLLDTGGAIKKAARFLEGDEPFLVHNVDILSDVDLHALYREHCRQNPLATLLVSERQTSRYLLFDKKNRLCGWLNKQTGETKSYYPDFSPEMYTPYAFGGIHVLSPRIFDWLDEWTGKFPVINFYLSIAAKADILAYPVPGLQLLDIGKPETLAEADILLAERWQDGAKKQENAVFPDK